MVCDQNTAINDNNFSQFLPLDFSLLPAILWLAVLKRLLQKCQGKEMLRKILWYSHNLSFNMI